MNTERIQSIDALRGFSLLGILIANMLSFQYDTRFKSVIEGEGFTNELAYYFTKIFVEGTFYPLFSFLFGYSLVQLIASINRQNRSLYPVLIRRAFGLLIIGFLHHIFIWSGDILINYGLTLFILPLFIKATPKVRRICAIVCIVIAVLLTGATYAMGDADSNSSATLATLEALQHGTYGDVLNNRLMFSLSDLPIPYVFIVIIFLLTMSFTAVVILPFALIGMNAAERGEFQHPQAAAAVKGKFNWIYFLFAGLLLKCCIFLDSAFGSFLFIVGGYMLTFGYIKLFVLLYEKLFHVRLQKFFASLGKLSLSTYLTQSIICTTIFYGYALGQFDKLGVAIGLLIAISLYILQGLVSYWYVTRFRQGPVEYILRRWTYWGKKRSVSSVIEHQQHM